MTPVRWSAVLTLTWMTPKVLALVAFADAADTVAAGTAANAVYAGAVAGLTQNDTIKFTYAGGAELTATIGAIVGATATAAEVQTAINTALTGAAFANGDVVASFTGADLTLTAHDTRALVGGAYADVDGAIADRSVADAVDTAAGAATPMLTLTNLANNGTVELTAAGAGVVVNITDAATGTADVLNLVTSNQAGAQVDLGTVVANGVETFNVTTTDTFVDANKDGLDDANSSVKLGLSSDRSPRLLSPALAMSNWYLPPVHWLKWTLRHSRASSNSRHR